MQYQVYPNRMIAQTKDVQLTCPFAYDAKRWSERLQEGRNAINTGKSTDIDLG